MGFCSNKKVGVILWKEKRERKHFILCPFYMHFNLSTWGHQWRKLLSIWNRSFFFLANRADLEVGDLFCNVHGRSCSNYQSRKSVGNSHDLVFRRRVGGLCNHSLGPSLCFFPRRICRPLLILAVYVSGILISTIDMRDEARWRPIEKAKVPTWKFAPQETSLAPGWEVVVRSVTMLPMSATLWLAVCACSPCSYEHTPLQQQVFN